MGSLWFSRAERRDFADLRAGWRFAIFAAAVAGPIALAQLILWWSGAGEAQAQLTPALALLSEAVPFLWVVLVTWLLARLEGQPFGRYGLPRRGAWGRNFWLGVGWGACALTLLLLLMRASGNFAFGAVTGSRASLLGNGAGWALAFLVVGLAEEFIFRGYALVTLAGGLEFWPAAVLLSALFGALHLGNSGESLVGALAAGLIGLFFCFTFRRTGSLWFAVGLHAAWDYCESFVYGVPDSGQVTPGRLLHPTFHGSRWLTGGAVGPEGSLWVFAVIALLFYLFARTHPAPAGEIAAAAPRP